MRLDSDARVRLHAAASALGLDDAAYVRMLIYRDANGGHGGSAPETVWQDAPARPALPDFRVAAAPSPVDEEPEPLPVAEMDIPADPDPDGGVASPSLDDLLRAGPSLLDEMAAASQPPVAGARMLAELAAPREPARSYRQAQQQVVPFGRPGSLTRPIGLNESAVGYMGDSPNSVLRQNLKHFGVQATRFR